MCEGGDAEVRIHHAVCRRGSCVLHASVDSVEAFGKVVTYPTKVEEYTILKHLHKRLRPPAAVPKPLCRAVGEYRGILTEKVNRETLDTLWARGEDPPPELVGEALKELHKALADLETPWCRPGTADEDDAEEWGTRPCLRAGLVAALATAIGEWVALDAAEAVLENCWRIRKMTRAGTGSRKQCIHGDLHLGQIVWGNGMLYFTDFSGEPLRWPAPQACAEPPVRDLATLITSINYLVNLTNKDGVWASSLIRRLLSGYGLSTDPEILKFWVIERASYELVYETVVGDGMVGIPAEFLREVLTSDDHLLVRAIYT